MENNEGGDEAVKEGGSTVMTSDKSGSLCKVIGT
jgi:hypothetical protein